MVDVAAAGTKLGKYQAVQEKKKKVKNKYAVCTASIGKTAKAGTKRSEWTKAEEERYESCKEKVEEISTAGGAGGGVGDIEGGPSLDGRGTKKRRKKQMPLGWYELEEEQEELEEDEIDPKPRRRRRTVVMKEKELAEAVYELFMNSGTI